MFFENSIGINRINEACYGTNNGKLATKNRIVISQEIWQGCYSDWSFLYHNILIF